MPPNQQQLNATPSSLPSSSSSTPRTPPYSRITSSFTPFQSRKKHRSYTLKQKLEALQLFDQFGITEAVKRTGIHRKRFYEWKRIEFEFSQFSNQRDQIVQRRLPGGGDNPKYILIEQHLVLWIHQQRKDGKIVTYSNLKDKAKEMATEIGLKSFRASPSWMHGFFGRNGLSYRLPTHTAQENNKPKTQKCYDMLIHLNAMNNACAEVDPSCVLNLDETPFWYDHMEKRTIDFVGNNSVTALHTEADKSRFTVTVTIAANGELLHFYVILK